MSLVGYHRLDGRPAFKIAVREVDGRYLLYLGHFWHSGWTVLDVTDPASPELVRFVEGPANTTTKQVQVADGLLICGLERPGTGGPVDREPYDPSEPYEAGAYVFDVAADPTDPQLLAHWDTGGRGTHRNFYAGGDYAYMCASPAGAEPTIDDPSVDPVKNCHLSVVDVSDPERPAEVATWRWPGQRPEARGESHSHYFHGPAYVRGDRAYLSYGRLGMVVLDVSTPRDPTLVYRGDFGGMLGGYNGVHSVVPVPGSDLAVVNSEAIAEGSPLDHERGDPLAYAFVVDVSDERDPGYEGRRHRGPRAVGTLPQPRPEPDRPYDTYYAKPARFGPHNQHHPEAAGPRLVTDEYVFMTWFNAGLRVFDVSNPLAPSEVGYYVPEAPAERVGSNRPRGELGTQLEDVVVDDRGYVYCTDPNHGLFVLESSFA